MRDLGFGVIEAASVILDRHPSMAAHHLSVLHAAHYQQELAVVGPRWEEFTALLNYRFRPEIAVAATAEPTSTPPLLAGRGNESGTAAYLCRNHVCDLPVDTVAALASKLEAAAPPLPDFKQT